MTPAKSTRAAAAELETVFFETPQEWGAWLEANGAASPGVWLRLAKKDSGLRSITYAQAVDEALCHGWIDGQARAADERSWLQRFTPRRSRSLWSQVNRDKVAALVASGRMRPAGLAEVERARADGRWEAAYAPPSTATVPDDLRAALDASPAAAAAFEALNGANRYAILFRVQTAKKAETRARRITQLVEMLERGDRLHP